jgi:signal transduction histidine kinase
LACLAVTLLTIVLFLVGLPAAYMHFTAVCSPDSCSSQLTPASARQLGSYGLSVAFYGAYLVALTTLFMAVNCLIAGFIWVKSHDRMAVFVSVMLVTEAAIVPPNLGVLATAHPQWQWPVEAVQFLGGITLYTFSFVFPDGRFVTRWTWILAATAVVVQAAMSFLPGWANDWPVVLQVLPVFGLLIPGVAAQVYRYQRVSTQVQRQQTKWVVFDVAAAVTGAVTVISVFAIVFPSLSANPLLSLLGQTALYGCVLIIPFSIGMAILRSRLWDIDLIINRTLVYGALTLTVVAAYVLVVGGLSRLVQPEGNLFISFLATALVAVLFQPLRERLQRGINHLMYGERDEPYAVLSRLGQRLEATVAPEAALSTIVETIAQALKLPYAAIGVRRGDALVTAAAYGSPVPSLLRLPLTYQQEAVGELILGPRGRGEEFGPADRRLLDDVARQVEVTDDGKGLPATAQAGVGLASMRERAAELGGSCDVEPGPAGGVRVRACLPMAPPDGVDDEREA